MCVATRAVSSASGQGAIVKFCEEIHQLEIQDNKYSWTRLPFALEKGIEGDVMMILPDDYAC